MGRIVLKMKRNSNTGLGRHFSITAQRLDSYGNSMGYLPVEVCEYDCCNFYYLIGPHQEIQLKDCYFDTPYGLECYKAEAAEITFVNTSRETIEVCKKTAFYDGFREYLPPQKKYTWTLTQKEKPQRPVCRPQKPSDWHSRVLEEKGITLSWQGDWEEYRVMTRRPACWTRGKPVTPQQAFEIICATDDFFNLAYLGAKLSEHDFIYTTIVSSWWFSSHFPPQYGWCRPDGRIGLDAITGRWPCGEDVIEDGTALLSAFPFLDLVGIIWSSEETTGFLPEEMEADPPYVEWGFHFHNNTIELLESQTAWERFCDCHNRYGEDPLTYMSGYNEKAGEKWVDFDYLKRCLQANGLPDSMAENSGLNLDWIGHSEYLPPESPVWTLYQMRYQRLLDACKSLGQQEQKERIEE